MSCLFTTRAANLTWYKSSVKLIFILEYGYRKNQYPKSSNNILSDARVPKSSPYAVIYCDLRVATTSLSPAFQNQTGLVIASMISITAGITVASIATKFSTTMFLLFSRK